MGWQDREYARDSRGSSWGSFGPARGAGAPGANVRAWWITTWLLALNIGIFLLSNLLGRGVLRIEGASVEMARLDPYMYFSIQQAFYEGEIWRLLTFQFMQWDLWHLFGNMLGLYVFGYMIEDYLGRARYIAFYLLCGVGGVVGYLFFALTGLMEFYPWTPMAGASAGIFGILIAAVYLAPEARVMLLFPPIPIKLKFLAWGLLAFALVMVLTNGSNAGGQAAHIGGAAFGFVFIRWPQVLNWARWAGGIGKAGPRVNTSRTTTTTGWGETARGTAGSIRPEPPRSAAINVDPREVDRILMKIGRYGLSSLSPEEKRVLDEATREQQQS